MCVGNILFAYLFSSNKYKYQANDVHFEGMGTEFNSAKLMFVTNWSFICYWCRVFSLCFFFFFFFVYFFLLCFAFINVFRRDLLIGNKYWLKFRQTSDQWYSQFYIFFFCINTFIMEAGSHDSHEV